MREKVLVRTVDYPDGTMMNRASLRDNTYKTGGGRVQLQNNSEKDIAVVCLQSLSEICKRLSEIYPAGLSIKDFTDFNIHFRIEFTCWDVFEALIVPFLERSQLEGVIERRTADYSYAGEMWVTLKFPKAAQHVIHTVYAGATYSYPRRKISVEKLASLLDDMIHVLEDRRN